MQQNNQKRIEWIDIAKGICMLLVVFGHTMRGGFAQRIVYSFHVAAFFFLSGMTCKTDRKLLRIKKDVLRIMVPYYCFGVISIAVFAVLGHIAAEKFGMNINTSVVDNLWNLLYANSKGGAMQYNTSLWFLPCLFVTKLMYYALDRVCRGKQIRILLTSILLGVLGYVYTTMKLPFPPFSLSIALKMMPFFSLGRIFFVLVCASDHPVFRRPANLALGIALTLSACAVGYFAPKVNYSGDTFPDIPAFLFTAVTGSLGITLISMGLERSKLLETVGRNTLAILVMHKFPVMLFQLAGPFKEILERNDTVFGNVCGGVPVTVLAIGMCLMVFAVIQRFFPFLFGMPYRTIQKNK